MAITPQQVGRALSRAGFRSQRGVSWAYGFKASKVMRGMVAVSAQFASEAREREALQEYAKTLADMGFGVHYDGGLTLIVNDSQPQE